jgi:hypothetical protein
MTAPHWSLRRRWGKAREAKEDQTRVPRKKLADMATEERAAHEVKRAQERARRAEALAAMTDEQREMYEAARSAETSARKSASAQRRARALASLDAHVDPLHVLGDFQLSERETAVPQSDATMRGVLLADFVRPNGDRALVMLREWKGELRILFTLAYVENGRPVRSRGWTLYLRDVTADGEVVPSTRELGAIIAALAEVQKRVASSDPALMAQIAAMHDARERWEREREGRPKTVEQENAEATQ